MFKLNGCKRNYKSIPHALFKMTNSRVLMIRMITAGGQPTMFHPLHIIILTVRFYNLQDKIMRVQDQLV